MMFLIEKTDDYEIHFNRDSGEFLGKSRGLETRAREFHCVRRRLHAFLRVGHLTPVATIWEKSNSAVTGGEVLHRINWCVELVQMAFHEGKAYWRSQYDATACLLGASAAEIDKFVQDEEAVLRTGDTHRVTVYHDTFVVRERLAEKARRML